MERIYVKTFNFEGKAGFGFCKILALEEAQLGTKAELGVERCCGLQGLNVRRSIFFFNR
jgi:hypothetical protein